MNKTRAELKQEAKDALRGHWGQSVAMYLIPVAIFLIIALVLIVPAITFYFMNNDLSSIAQSGQDSYNTGSGATGGTGGGLIAMFFTVGISWTLLDVLRNPMRQISPLKDAVRVAKSPYLLGYIGLYFLMAIFTFLWTLLLIIPGIVKSYSYSQSYYLMYDAIEKNGERPGFLDTITASRKLMDGHKMELFVLDLSFLPWHILCWFTLGIGYLWLMPYITMTKAAFYENLLENSEVF